MYCFSEITRDISQNTRELVHIHVTAGDREAMELRKADTHAEFAAVRRSVPTSV